MKIPELIDFTEVVPPEDDLDAYYAWREFGGLDLAQAYDKFLERPDFSQEDFMFMGARAFLYYFPVIDRYIREVEAPKNRFDDEAWILGLCIEIQFSRAPETLAPIRSQAESLCKFVLGGLVWLSDGDTTRPVREIVEAWTKAKTSVSSKPADTGSSSPCS